MSKIQFSEVFENTTFDLIDHLSCYSDEDSVIARIETFIDRFVERVSNNPLSCQICPHLVEVGVIRYREYNFDGLRIIYKINGDVIEADVLLSQKQDIQQVLINYCLVHK